MTNQELIFVPALALVLLTFMVWVWMYVTRIAEMRRAHIDPQRLATRAVAGPLLARVGAPSDNLINLFELPVLFYFLVVLLYETGLTDALYLLLASAFVVLRYVHSFIHITYNRVMHRFLVYVTSALLLWIMWGRFAWQLVELTRLNG